MIRVDIALLATLPRLARQDEVLTLVTDRELHGKGLGWMDAHLPASAVLSSCPLWTRDKAPAAAASGLGVGA